MSKNTGTSELINYFDLGENGDVAIAGSLDINTILQAESDTDKFLVSDTGIIKYRTGAQLLSDIGAQGALTNAVTGTGTSGTIPVFTGSTTLGDSIIQANANQVNIVGLGSSLLFDSLGDIASGGIQYINDFVLKVYNSRGSGSAIELGNQHIDLITDSTTRLRITNTGNVLIGSPPAADNGTRLQVDGSVEVSINNAFRIDGGRFLLYNGGTFIGDIDNKGGAVYIREDGLNVITIEEQNTTFIGSVTARNTISINASTAGGTSSININGLGSGGTSVAGTRIDGIPEGSGPAASMGFVTRDSAGNRTEKMRITSEGSLLTYGNVTVGGGNNNSNLNYAANGQTWIGSNRLRYNQSTGLFSRALATEQASMIVLGTDASIKFYTQPSTIQTGSYSLTPPMTLLGNDNLLIGTTTDSGYKLNVVKNSGLPSTSLLSRFSNEGAAFNVEVTSGGSGSFGIVNLISTSGGTGQATSGAFAFTTRNAGITSEKVRITSGGNVLIGTETDNGYKLFVSGNTYLDGSIEAATFSSTGASLTVNANNEKKSGFYRWNSTSTNLPESGFFAVVIYGNSDNVVAQMATHFQNANTYVRAFNTAWSAWKRLDT